MEEMHKTQNNKYLYLRKMYFLKNILLMGYNSTNINDHYYFNILGRFKRCECYLGNQSVIH